MTNREKIISNDFYDIVADYVLLEELRASAPAYVYQPVGGEIGIAYIERNKFPPLSVGGMYPYESIPKLYGLMQDTFDPAPLLVSGITAVSRPPLSLTGRGVVVGFLDTGIDYQNPVFLNEDGGTRLFGNLGSDDTGGRAACRNLLWNGVPEGCYQCRPAKRRSPKYCTECG